MVSVVMPVYNAQGFLQKAMDSVLAQSYKDVELVVIDDCSTDGSLEIVRAFEKKDSRVRVIAFEENMGVAEARNRGIHEATGDYIALLDSDDIWLLDKLQKQVELIEETNADVVYCSYDLIDTEGKQIGKPFIVPKSTNYKKMLSKCVFSCSTTLFKAELLKKHLFNPEYYHEDFVLWLELMRIPIKAVGDPQILVHYRQVENSRSHDKFHAAIHRWKIYREILHLNLVQTTIVFVKYSINGIFKYYK